MPTKEELEEQLAKTRADMKVLASMATERAEMAALELRGDVKDRVSLLSEEAQALLDEAASEGRRMADDAESTIRAHPFATAGIAFGIGMLLGAVLRR